MTRARDVANLIGSGNYSSTTFTATAGQTAFTIAHTQGFVQVFMNGLLLDETADYTSNGTAITLTSGAAAGDEIEVVKYNTFSVGDAIPASGGTFTGSIDASAGLTTPAGHVIQVVVGELSTNNVSSTTTSYASTGLTCSITPSSTSSKVLVMVNVVGLYKTGADAGVALKITDGTSSYEFDTATAYDGTTGPNAVGGSSYSRLWTPSSTNQQTYTLEFANPNGSGTAFINARWSSSYPGTRSTITAMEIAG